MDIMRCDLRTFIGIDARLKMTPPRIRFWLPCFAFLIYWRFDF